MRSSEFLDESINDKGILKAVIFGGTPGAGKSYVLNKISSGSIDARVVNTDKMLEFLGKQKGIPLTKENQLTLVDKADRLTINQLAQYVNGMLPLFIDGTSSNAPSTLRRVGILESFGYDVGFVWVETDLEVAIARAARREREVDEDFIRSVHEKSLENKEYFQHKFSNFTTVRNNDGELTDQAVQKAFKATTNFFTQPIHNPVGKRIVRRMESEGMAYLVPDIYSKEDIISILNVWYRGT